MVSIRVKLFCNAILGEPIVSVIKGREGMHKYPDRSGHLPFLHEYPVV